MKAPEAITTAGTTADTSASVATAAGAAALAVTTTTTVTVIKGVETGDMEAGTTVEAGPRAATTATTAVAMEVAAAAAAATEEAAAAVVAEAAGAGRPGGALTPTRDGSSIREYLQGCKPNKRLGSGGYPDPENNSY